MMLLYWMVCKTMTWLVVLMTWIQMMEIQLWSGLMALKALEHLKNNTKIPA